MARVEVKNSPLFNFEALHLIGIYGAFSYVRASEVYQASYGFYRSDTFRGHGLSYDGSGHLAGGVVTSYQMKAFGKVHYTLSGLSISAADLAAAAFTGPDIDDVALIKAEFAGNDVLIGGTAFDILEGLGGHDQLRGMDGPDTLVGGAGNDVIVGGSGKDALIGGPGFDRFRLEEASDSTLLYRDVIRDFRRGEDKLDLSKIDADAYGAAGNQAFRFIGGRPFSGEPGELRFEKGVVSGDVTGGGYPEFAIRVAGPTFMSAADFVL